MVIDFGHTVRIGQSSNVINEIWRRVAINSVVKLVAADKEFFWGERELTG